MAEEWGKLSYCKRKQVGAIIVRDRMIISDGYNGTPTGFENFCEDDEGYIADIPDLKYCSAFGETQIEALQELGLAKQVWIEAAKADGKPVPPPTYQPIIYQLKSA